MPWADISLIVVVALIAVSAFRWTWKSGYSTGHGDGWRQGWNSCQQGNLNVRNNARNRDRIRRGRL